MNKWFEEYWQNHTGRNRFVTTSYYNPSAGEFYLHSFFGLMSGVIAFYNFITYMQKHEMILAVILGVLALGFGIAGLILSFKNIPYALRCKSIYMVSTVVSGILLSLFGIIFCIVLGVMIYVSQN